MTTDRHKGQPKAVRRPDGLLARVEAAAKIDGVRVNGFIVAAIEEHLARREGGSTPPAVKAMRGSTTRARKPREDTAPAATFKQPEQPPQRAHAPTCKCGICKPGGK